MWMRQTLHRISKRSWSSLWAGVLAAVLVPAAGFAEDAAGYPAATNAPGEAAGDTRYGLGNGLDRRSFYNEGNYPEPFLVDDSGLERNEARLDWWHTKAGDAHMDWTRLEVERGFGLVTVELELPYERDVNRGVVTEGFDNLDLGVRCPFYQYVSRTGWFDTTFGGGFEVGIPVDTKMSINPEFVPKVFNDTRLGSGFTVQTVLGYSVFGGGGEQGGLRTFEYGFTFGYTIQHRELPLPGVRQFIPMFELSGEKGLNHDATGENKLEGNIAFRLNLNPLGRVQPRLGFGYVFPLTAAARTELHSGYFTSLVFEY